MQEQLSEVLFYIKGTLKYKWVIMIVAWLVCLSGWIYINNMPDKYKSKAIVSVDSRTMLRPLLRGMAIQSNTRGMVQVMRQLMFTRPKLEKVAQLADLDLESKNEKQKRAIISMLKRNTRISGGRNDLFSISYEADEAKEAQNVVHAVLTVFSEQAHLRAGTDTGSAQQFIEEQIREYEVRLQNAEKARENFKRVNSELLPNQGGGQLGSLRGTKAKLEAANMALSEANSRWYVLKRQMSEVVETDEDWGVTDLVTTMSTPEDAQIEVLNARINELLLKYTLNHPGILSLQSTIADLEQAKQERLANAPKNQTIVSSGAISNPYVQSLKLSMNKVESERASIRSRVNVLNQRIIDIQNGLDARLRIATEMQNLDRDYSVIKSNYMKLIQRREQASMTEKAARSQDVLRFKIIEAPSVPLEPSSPKRKVLNSSVLGAGFIAGMISAFLIYFIRPSFMSTRQVRAVTGLPILGSVSIQRTDSKLNVSSNILLFWIFGALLIVVYALAMSNIFAGGNIREQLMNFISL